MPNYPKGAIRQLITGEKIEDLANRHQHELWTDPRQPRWLPGNDKEWRRPRDFCNRPKFIDGKPSRFDAIQGDQGNCWLVSAIEAVTLNESLINHVVPPGQSFDHNYIGAFHFRIWQLGIWYDVVVDDRLPIYISNYKLVYAHSNRGDIFWAALLEKAYAKVYGDFTLNQFYIEDLGSGYSMDVLQDLSGGIIERVLTDNPPYGTNLKSFLHNCFFTQNSLMTCRRYNTIEPELGIFEKHAYAITEMWKTNDNDPDYHGLFLIRILNPWGDTEWQGEWRDSQINLWKQIDTEIRQRINFVDRDDGEFWMSYEDFKKYFERIFICYLGPGEFVASHRGEGKQGVMSTVSLYGEWVRNVSAGGSGILTRHTNPQFKLQIDKPRGRERKINVVIELIQKLKQERWEDRPYVAFYIYSLKDLYHITMPLNQEFFQNHKALEEYPDFNIGFGRGFVMSMNLEAGAYCIVPCSDRKGAEASFMLRVYSHDPVDLKLVDHDTKISKSVPMEEQIPNESYEGLKRLFNDVANEQDEIDWIGLKEILKAAMHPSISLFGVTISFFKYIQNFFENLLPFWSSNDYKPEVVVFTKDECRSMIAMLDDNHSGKLSFFEFINLWNKICFWIKVYNQHRDETVGYVTVPQLRDALGSIGYDLNKRAVHSIVYVFANEQGHILLTDFIICGVTLETVLSRSQKEDFEDGNKRTFNLEEWVRNTLNL